MRLHPVTHGWRITLAGICTVRGDASNLRILACSTFKFSCSFQLARTEIPRSGCQSNRHDMTLGGVLESLTYCGVVYKRNQPSSRSHVICLLHNWYRENPISDLHQQQFQSYLSPKCICRSKCQSFNSIKKWMILRKAMPQCRCFGNYVLIVARLWSENCRFK